MYIRTQPYNDSNHGSDGQNIQSDRAMIKLVHGWFTMFVLIFAGLLIILFQPPAQVQAQISLAPTILFFHDDDPATRLTVRNTSSTPQEVEIDARFGYPASDEEGNLSLMYDDEAFEARHGLSEHLRFFPRRFVLAPGDFQRVRLMVQNMDNRPEGLYWTRLQITSSEVTPDLGDPEEEGVGTRINYRIRQNIGVFFHQGHVAAALSLNELQTRVEGDELLLDMRMESGGNSPFLGTLRARLTDGSGSLATEGEWLFSVFGSRYWPHRMDVNGLAPGRYRLDLEMVPERSDVNRGDIPEAEPLRESLFIEI